ncbi:MAG: acylphosphatase [Chloroflexota bacterium]
MERKRILVTGELRGAGFGSGGWRKAHALLLGGFMDKQRDGSFLFEVEGRPEDVEQFVEWARRGSPRAVIASVEVTETAPLGETVFRKIERENDERDDEGPGGSSDSSGGDSDSDSDDSDDGLGGNAKQLARRAARKAERKAQRRAEKAGAAE